jgi:DNA-binding SARP family transcriptional activator
MGMIDERGPSVVRVLGPIQVVVASGRAIEPASASQRRLLAVLALHAPHAVRAERLAAVLDLSASGLRTGVTRLRRALGPDALVSTSGGYQLTAPVDTQRFDQAMAATRQLTTATPDARCRALRAALALCRGPALEEFAHEEWAMGEATRLDEMHAAATEDLVEALVDAGRCAEAIATISEHIARLPLRDRARGLLLRALAGAGRQAEALRAYRAYRTMLAEEVGTEPSPDVRRIEQRVAAGWDGRDRERAVDRAAAVVDARAVPRSLASARSGPFVGRDDLLAELLDSWRDDRWSSLVLAGEPGVGTTRLLAELAHAMHNEGATVAVGRGDEDAVLSHRPWADVLMPLLSALDPSVRDALPAEHLAELARLAPTGAPNRSVTGPARPGDDHQPDRALVDAVVALLGAAAPVVVVLDDLHWIDTPSLRVLQQVVAADLPGVTVLAAYRYTDVRRRDPLAAALADLRRLDRVRRLTVHGLDEQAVEALVAAMGREVPDAERHALAQAIRSRTAGNALFVRELILHLATREEAATDLPDGLVELIDRRVARLGDDTVDVLRVAAVVGQRFRVDVVEDVVHLDRARRGVSGRPSSDVIGDLELARDAAVIVDDDDGMEFRHAVVRAALLGQMSAARRQRLHRDIATVLERTAATAPAETLAALAHHHDLARSPEAPGWYRRAAKAATDAFDVGAVQLAERGLELLVGTDADPVLHCDLLIARAMGLRLTGHETLADARTAAEAAMALGDEARIASALQTLSVRSIDRDASDHIAFLAEGLRHLADASQTSRWSVAVGLSLRKVMLPTADASEHRAELDEIVAHLDPDDPAACRLAMRCARSLTAINHPRDALVITERFGPGCHGVDSDGMPVDLGLSTMWLHLGDRAASDRCLDLAAGDPLRRSAPFDCQVRQRLAMRHLLDGRWDDAAAEIDEARARGAHDPTIRLGCDAQANWLRREQGDAEACYVATSERAEQQPGLVLVQAMLASVAAEAGHDGVARAQLARLSSDDYAAAGRQWMAVLTLGHLAWATVTIEAREHAAALRRLLGPYGGQLAVTGTGIIVMAAIDRLLAALADLDGDHDAADTLFAAALAQEVAVRSAPLAARTRHWWGRAHLRRGDRDGAAPLLTAARATADDLAMAGLLAQLDALDVES